MKKWTSISKNPNDSLVKKERVKSLYSLRNLDIISDRIEYLKSLATGKKVLDIGVVEHTINE